MSHRLFRRSSRLSRREHSFEGLESRELLTFITQIGGTGNVYTPWNMSLVADAEGNSYIGGRFQGTADFDPGPGIYPLSSEESTAFVAKYDSQGALVWARGFEMVVDGKPTHFTSPIAMTGSLALDGNGNVFATGNFNYSVDLMGNGSFVSAGRESDAFVVKLNAATGTTVWAKTVGAAGSDRGSAIAVGDDGHAYVGEGYSGTVDFDPGGGTDETYELTAPVTRTATFCTSTQTGTSWTLGAFGGPTEERVGQLVLDGSTLFVAGSFLETADFDPGPSSELRTSAGSWDHFFASYKTDGPTEGKLNWVQSIGNEGIQLGWTSLAVNETSLFVASTTWGEGWILISTRVSRRTT